MNEAKVSVRLFEEEPDAEGCTWRAQLGDTTDEALIGHGTSPAMALQTLAAGLEMSPSLDGGARLVRTAREQMRIPA